MAGPSQTVQRYVRLTGAANGAEIRTAVFEGEDHLVVPVVAMRGDIVVRALNSDGPEFVPAGELAYAPKGWDGRPIVPDHPQGGRASANEPRTLETRSFGRMFHTEYRDGALRTEAYINPARARELGGDPKAVVERLENHETVEVSVGAFITVERAPGSHEGTPYVAIWRHIVPDHLAMLPEGVEGACSVEDGCGAPRANSVLVGVTAHGIQAQMRAAELEADMSKRTRGAAEGVSDENLRSWLTQAIEESDSDAEFVWVEAVFDDTVVYTVGREGEPSELLERSYTLNEDSEAVTLTGDAAPVRRHVEYRPARAGLTKRILEALGIRSAAQEGVSDIDLREALRAALHAEDAPSIKSLVGALIDNKHAPYGEEDGATLSGFSRERLLELTDDFKAAAATKADCGCNNPPGDGHAAPTNNPGGHTMTKSEELVGQLITNEASPFTEADKDWLSESTEERLAEMVRHCEEATPTPDSTPTPDPKADEPDPAPEAPAPEPKADGDVVQLSQKQYDEMKEATDAWKLQRAAEKAAIVKTLSGKQEGYSAEDLEEMSIPQLRKLSKALKIDDPTPDYSLQGLADGEADGPETVDAPPDMIAAVRKRREAATA